MKRRKQIEHWLESNQSFREFAEAIISADVRQDPPDSHVNVEVKPEGDDALGIMARMRETN